MSHLLHDYVAEQLAGHVEDRRVVVWFDPRGEFEPFVSELGVGATSDDIAEVALGSTDVAVVTFDGSMFALRSLVEPLVDGDDPSRLIIYLAGVERTDDSPLMELELAGFRWEPQLRRLARKGLPRGGVTSDLWC